VRLGLKAFKVKSKSFGRERYATVTTADSLPARRFFSWLEK